MAFDFKKEYRALYLPPDAPGIVTVPSMSFIAVRGRGDPNLSDGDYAQAIGLLYAVAYTIRMSAKAGHSIRGFFDYVVPPLEGFWRQAGAAAGEIDYARKEDLQWISAIRLPDFVTWADHEWALQAAAEKKKMDLSRVEFLTYEEGLCVQCLHIGPYDDEPATVARMHAYIQQQGCALDITDRRLHHEIYLSDARRVAPEKRRTVIRHPILRL